MFSIRTMDHNDSGEHELCDRAHQAGHDYGVWVHVPCHQVANTVMSGRHFGAPV